MSKDGLGFGGRLGHSARTLFWLGLSLHLLILAAGLVFGGIWNAWLRGLLTFIIFLVSVVGNYLLLEWLRGGRPLPNTAVLGLWALLHVPCLVLAHHWAEYRIYANGEPVVCKAEEVGQRGEAIFLNISSGAIDTSICFTSIYKYKAPKSKSNSNPQTRHIEYKISPLRAADNRVVGYICYNSDDAPNADFDLKYTLFRPFWTKFNARYPTYIDSLQQKFGLPRDGSERQIFELLDLAQVSADYYWNIRLAYIIIWAVIFLLSLMGPDRD